ncbi:hypothetical protein YC2023_118349 [Brassica napus]
MRDELGERKRIDKEIETALRGLIDEGTRDGFNIPAYMRSPEEVAAGVDRIGGFKIEKMEYRKLVEYSDEKHED